MKLTQSQLKNLIREELSKLSEMAGIQGGDEQNNPGEAENKPKGMKTSYGHVEKVDEGDEREEHNIDDLWAMVRNLRDEVKRLADK